jgi:hypothetical protein
MAEKRHAPSEKAAKENSVFWPAAQLALSGNF